MQHFRTRTPLVLFARPSRAVPSAAEVREAHAPPKKKTGRRVSDFGGADGATPGGRLKALRLSVGLTQSELGALCGMAINFVSSLETGRVNITARSRRRLAKVLVAAGADRDAVRAWKEGG